jgi:poly-gamma-glutamate synthesis protein (capsule biosynthesis protein)
MHLCGAQRFLADFCRPVARRRVTRTYAEGVGNKSRSIRTLHAAATASNHTIDQGTEGLSRTLDVLDAAGLEHTGSYRTRAESAGILMLQTKAARIAVIAGTYGLNGQVPEQPWQVDMLDAAAMIGKAKLARSQGADIVLAAMHAGDEYASAPNAQQLEVARALADSGQFTLIYGHHTHSVLPIEKYKGTWIASRPGPEPTSC